MARKLLNLFRCVGAFYLVVDLMATLSQCPYSDSAFLGPDFNDDIIKLAASIAKSKAAAADKLVAVTVQTVGINFDRN